MIQGSKLGKEMRREQILAAALALAERDGYQNVTRRAVAGRAECSTGLVSKYFSTMQQLKRAVMRAAVAQGTLPIIAQGLAAKDRHALKAPDKLKAQALASLT